MGKSDSVGWARPYSRIYRVKDADNLKPEFDFKHRQRTSSKGCRYTGWLNLEDFALLGRDRSEFY